MRWRIAAAILYSVLAVSIAYRQQSVFALIYLVVSIGFWCSALMYQESQAQK